MRSFRVARSLCALMVMVFCLAIPRSGQRVQAQPSPTAIVDRIRSNGVNPIDFHAAVFPDSVYVGQQITYQVAVLLSDQARSRLRRNPEFLPPELRGLLAYELGTPTRVPSRSYGGGSAYEAHVFQRALFGVTAGTLRVPAPQLTYSLPQSSSYFSREERYVVRAESALMVVKPLPEEGRPADFTGAVGVLRASARFDRRGNSGNGESGEVARVGDPLVLTVRIEGTGNVKLLPRPAVELSWATVVAGSERVQVDTSGSLVRGAKEFDFILTPSQPGAVTLPVLRYAYFDPYKAIYDYAQTAPADVRVADGDRVTGGGLADDGEALPLRAWRRNDAWSIEALPNGVVVAVLLLLALAPAPAVATLLTRRRARRGSGGSRTDVPTIREDVVDDTSDAGRARRTRRTLLAHIASRLQVVPTELVTPADMERVLRRRGVTRATTTQVLRVLDELASLGFGGDNVAPQVADRLNTEAAALLDRVKTEAVTHGRTRLWARRAVRSGSTFVLAALLGSPALPSWMHGALGAQAEPALVQAPPPNAPAGASADGCSASRGAPGSPLNVMAGEATAAYQARRFSRAAEQFASAASRCPRDVDLLINWGNAAWATNDTVSAVIAWQRAARLDPLAADVQERLALLPAGARGGIAEIPLVPVVALSILAVVAWLGAWALFFVAWRRSAGTGTWALVATLSLCVALAAGGTAWWGQRALDPSGLAVVRRPETMRTAPGFDANTSGGVATGDVVRMAAAQEGWFRIEHTDGRNGWIPASRLAPLVAGPVTR